MPKTITFNSVNNLNMTIRINEPAALADGTPGYLAISIVTNGQALADDGSTRDYQIVTPIGSPRATKYTPAELAPILKGSANSTGNFLVSEFGKLITKAIGETV